MKNLGVTVTGIRHSGAALRCYSITARRCSNNDPVPSIHQTISGRQRFYKHVDVVQCSSRGSSEEIAGSGQFSITLDGKVLKTPAKNPLVLPSHALAVAIGIEWDAQTDRRLGIQPVNMPLMSLACTAIDQVQFDSETTIRTCMKYLPTDTALFMTSESDRLLLEKQKRLFIPLVEWYRQQLGVALPFTSSLANKIHHPSETMIKFEGLIRKMDHFTLACLQGATAECKSVLLSLAFIARRLDLSEAIEASRLEEEFQLEIWGVVEGGHDMDRLNNAARLSSVGTFMHLYKDHVDMQHLWRHLSE